MTSKEWEDICIGFDEYGFQPSTLCNDEEVINEYRKAFKDVLKELELLEKYKRVMCEPIQALMQDLKELDTYRNEKYKHWNIFFNGAKLEYLLYLEQKGKESFMTSISEELYSKIHKHFLE